MVLLKYPRFELVEQAARTPPPCLKIEQFSSFRDISNAAGGSGIMLAAKPDLVCRWSRQLRIRCLMSLPAILAYWIELVDVPTIGVDNKTVGNQPFPANRAQRLAISTDSGRSSWSVHAMRAAKRACNPLFIAYPGANLDGSA